MLKLYRIYFHNATIYDDGYLRVTEDKIDGILTEDYVLITLTDKITVSFHNLFTRISQQYYSTDSFYLPGNYFLETPQYDDYANLSIQNIRVKNPCQDTILKQIAIAEKMFMEK